MVRTYFDPKNGKLRVELGSGSGPAIEVDDPQTGVLGVNPNQKSVPFVSPVVKPNPAPSKIKDFYLPGDPDMPMDLEYDIEDRDGEMVAVPKTPEYPEARAKADAESLQTGYDQDTGEFVAGTFAKPETPKEVATDNGLADAWETGTLFVQKNRLGERLRKAQDQGDTQGALALANEIKANEEAIAESTKGYENSVATILGSVDMADPTAVFDLAGKAAWLGAHEMASFAPQLFDAAGLPAAAGAIGGAIVGGGLGSLTGVGTAPGAVAGAKAGAEVMAWAGLSEFYANQNVSDQITNARGEYTNPMAPGGANVVPKADFERALAAGTAMATADIILGKAAGRFVGVLANPALSNTVAKRLGRRVLGLGATIGVGGGQEAVQDWAQQVGSTLDLGVFEVFDDPKRVNSLIDNFLIGSFIPFGIGSTAVAGATAIDVGKKTLGPKGLPKLPKFKPDTEALDKEETVLEAPKVETPEETPKVEPEVEVTPDNISDDDIPKGVAKDQPRTIFPDDWEPKSKAPAYQDDAGNKTWEEFEASAPYNVLSERINEHTKDIDALAEPIKEKSELHARALAAGIDPAVIVQRVNENEDVPAHLKESFADHLLDAQVRASEQIGVNRAFAGNEEVQDLKTDAVSASKANPKRAKKVDSISEATGGDPDLLHSLSDTDLNAIHNKFKKDKKVEKVHAEVKRANEDSDDRVLGAKIKDFEDSIAAQENRISRAPTEEEVDKYLKENDPQGAMRFEANADGLTDRELAIEELTSLREQTLAHSRKEGNLKFLYDKLAEARAEQAAILQKRIEDQGAVLTKATADTPSPQPNPAEPTSLPSSLPETDRQNTQDTQGEGPNMYDPTVKKVGVDTPFTDEDLADPEVKVVVDRIKEMFELLMKRLIPDNSRTFDPEFDVLQESVVKNRETGEVLGKSGGFFDPNNGFIKLVLGFSEDIKFMLGAINPDGKTETNNFMWAKAEAILHELVHAIDAMRILSPSDRKRLQKETKAIKDRLLKAGHLDPKTIEILGQDEILAYGFTEWVFNSNDKEAASLRDFVAHVVARKKMPPDIRTPMANKVYRALADFLKKIMDFISSRPDSFFRKIAKANAKAKPPLIRATEGQLERLQIAAQKADDNEAAKSYLEPKQQTITEALDRNRTIAKNRPLDVFELNDIVKDPNNWGFQSRLAAWIQKGRSLRNFAKSDKVAAWVKQLIEGFETDVAKYLHAWQGPQQELQKIKNLNALFERALYLRKTDQTLKNIGEDGRLSYETEDGAVQKMSAADTANLKFMVQTFSLPLKAHADIARARLGSFVGKSGFKDMPINGTATQLGQWVYDYNEMMKEARKNGAGNSNFDMKALNRVKDLVGTITEYESLQDDQTIYVPEMRFGNWAIAVRDKRTGELVGLHDLESRFTAPKDKEARAFEAEVKAKYKGQNVDITPLFEMTYNDTGKRINANEATIDLLASFMAQRLSGTIKANKTLSFEEKQQWSPEAIAADTGRYLNTHGITKHLTYSRHINGSSTDGRRVVASFLNSMAYSASHSKWHDLVRLTQQELSSKADGIKGRKYKMLLDDLTYAQERAPDKIEALIRTYTFFQSLGFNVSTALMQYSSLVNLVPANLSSIGISPVRALGAIKGALKMTGSMSQDHIKNFTTEKDWFTPKTLRAAASGYFQDKDAVEAFVRDALKDTDHLVPALADEGRTLSGADVASKSKNWKDTVYRTGTLAGSKMQAGAAYMMTLTERAARTATYATVYKSLYGDKTALADAVATLSKEPSFQMLKKFNPGMSDIRAVANYIVEDSFGNPQRGLKARYTRGKLGALVFNYSNIPAQLLEQHLALILPKRLGGLRGGRGTAGALLAVATMALIGGTAASTWGLNAILDKLLEIFRDGDTPGELQSKALLVEMFGGKAMARRLGLTEDQLGEILQKGLLSQAGLGSMSRRMALSPPYQNLVLTGLEGGNPAATDLIGATGSTAAGLIGGISNQLQGRGDLVSNFSPVVPAVIRNVWRAAQMNNEGPVLTSRGKPVARYEDYSFSDKVMTAMGIQTSKAQKDQLRNRLDQMRQSTNEDIKTRYKNNLIRLLYQYKVEGNDTARADYKRELGLFYEALEERGEAFTLKQRKRFESEVYKSVKRMIDPESEEGLTKGQVQGRRDLEDITRLTDD